jgi:nitroreductase
MPEITIHDALVSRRSVRKFSNKEVPEDLIRDIVKDAQWAPSWANAQPWKLYVATGGTARAIRNAYKNDSLPQNIDLSSFDGENWGNSSMKNMRHWGQQLQHFLAPDSSTAFGEAQNNLFDAPAIAVITVSKNAPVWEILDAGAFEQSLLLSAYGHGVDSIVAVAFVAHAAYLHTVLEIPDTEEIVMGIGLGYRTNDKINNFKSDRIPLQQYADVIHHQSHSAPFGSIEILRVNDLICS